jgi:hypothetical protein
VHPLKLEVCLRVSSSSFSTGKVILGRGAPTALSAKLGAVPHDYLALGGGDGSRAPSTPLGDQKCELISTQHHTPNPQGSYGSLWGAASLHLREQEKPATIAKNLSVRDEMCQACEGNKFDVHAGPLTSPNFKGVSLPSTP